MTGAVLRALWLELRRDRGALVMAFLLPVRLLPRLRLDLRGCGRQRPAHQARRRAVDRGRERGRPAGRPRCRSGHPHPRQGPGGGCRARGTCRAGWQGRRRPRLPWRLGGTRHRGADRRALRSDAGSRGQHAVRSPAARVRGHAAGRGLGRHDPDARCAVPLAQRRTTPARRAGSAGDAQRTAGAGPVLRTCPDQPADRDPQEGEHEHDRVLRRRGGDPLRALLRRARRGLVARRQGSRHHRSRARGTRGYEGARPRALPLRRGAGASRRS